MSESDPPAEPDDPNSLRGKRGVLVFSDPRGKDFFAWRGPTVTQLIEAATSVPQSEEMEEFKAITIRPTLQEVALLDELATILGESRNMAARRLLVAAMREALNALPEDRRRKVQAEAFKKLGWGIVTPQKVAEINERGKQGGGTPFSELMGAPAWLDEDEPPKP